MLSLQLGYLKHQKHDLQTAIKIFKKLLKIDSKHSDAYQMLGLMAMDDGDYKSAVNYLENSYDNEKDHNVYLNIVESYLELEQLEKAFEMLEKLDISDLDDDEYEVYNSLRADYFLAKAIECWSGSKKDESGNEVYFPDSLGELDDGKHFVEMAKIQESKDQDIIDRIKVFEEVLDTNATRLNAFFCKEEKIYIYHESNEKETQDESTKSLSENDQKAWNKLEEVFDLWTEIDVQDGYEYRWPKTIEELDASKKLFKEIRKLKPKDKAVRNRLKELEQVVKDSKKVGSQLPTNVYSFFCNQYHCSNCLDCCL